MRYFKVTNRETRNAQILNNEEFSLFFKKNNIRDYAIYKTLSPKDKQINDFIDSVAISFFSLAFIVLTTHLITNLI